MRKVPVWKVVLELVRSFVVTLVMAHVIVLARIAGWLDAAQLAIWIAKRVSSHDPDGLCHMG